MRWRAVRLFSNVRRTSFSHKAVPIMSIVSISALLAGCSLLPQQEQPLQPPLVKQSSVPYQTAIVKRGTIEYRVSGSASFTALRQYDLSMRDATGRITEIDVKPGEQVHQGEVLVRTDTSQQQYQLQLAQLQLEKDQVIVNQRKSDRANTYQIQISQLNVQTDEVTIHYLQHQLQESNLVSPVSGIVTSLSSIKIGDAVKPYETLVSVSDPRDLTLDYESPDGSDIMNVKVGMLAHLQYHGTSLVGRVVEVQSHLPLSNVTLNIAPERIPPGATMGEAVNYSIVVQRSINTLIVPSNAVNSLGTKASVRVLTGQAVSYVTVQTGIQTATQTQILSGLTEGQRVILN